LTPISVAFFSHSNSSLQIRLGVPSRALREATLKILRGFICIDRRYEKEAQYNAHHRGKTPMVSTAMESTTLAPVTSHAHDPLAYIHPAQSAMMVETSKRNIEMLSVNLTIVHSRAIQPSIEWIIVLTVHVGSNRVFAGTCKGFGSARGL
jgi:hypothetical protein